MTVVKMIDDDDHDDDKNNDGQDDCDVYAGDYAIEDDFRPPHLFLAYSASVIYRPTDRRSNGQTLLYKCENFESQYGLLSYIFYECNTIFFRPFWMLWNECQA